MEQEKNNKGVIALLAVIIVILLALVVLLATGTINLKSNSVDNSDQSGVNITENDDVVADTTTNTSDDNVENATDKSENATGKSDDNKEVSENKSYSISYDDIAGTYIYPNDGTNSYITFWNNGTVYLELPSRYDKKITSGKFGNYIIKNNEIVVNYLIYLDPCEDFYIENSSKFYGTDKIVVNSKDNDGFSIVLNDKAKKLQYANIEKPKDFDTVFNKYTNLDLKEIKCSY